MKNKDKFIKELRERLTICYNAYMQTLRTQCSEDLISQAAEIAAAKVVYEEIMTSDYDPLLLQNLAQLEQPLETLRDEWMKNHGFDHSVDMQCILGNLPETHDLSHTDEPEQNGGMSLCQY